MKDKNIHRNNLVIGLRDTGLTLQQIGDKFGLSREYIRQILIGERGNTDIPRYFINEKELAKLVGTNGGTVCRWRKKGLITPIASSPHQYLYNKSEVDKIMGMLKVKVCKYCGKDISDLPLGRVRCSDCNEDSKTNAYRYKSPEAKKKHSESCRNWQLKHPEEYRIIQNRAQENWRKRQKEKSL